MDSGRTASYLKNEFENVTTLDGFLTKTRCCFGDRGNIPGYDQNGGGTDAKVLILLEAPGPKAVESKRISLSNLDPTANNLSELLSEAKISKTEVILWNVVPWYVGNEGRIRPVRLNEIRDASTSLAYLIKMLPNLKAIVFMGKKAQKAIQFCEVRPDTVFETWHPSATVKNCWPTYYEEILACLKKIAELLN